MQFVVVNNLVAAGGDCRVVSARGTTPDGYCKSHPPA
jgi:hypothetical protein